MFNQYTKTTPPQSHLPASLHPCSSIGASLYNSPDNNDLRSLAPRAYPSFNVTDSSPSAFKYHPFRLSNFSNINNSAFEKLTDEDTFTMPSLTEPRFACFNYAHQSNDRERSSSLNPCPSKLLSTIHEKQMKGCDTTDLKNKKGHELSEVHQVPADRSVLAVSTKDNVLVDVSLSPSSEVDNSASLKRKFASIANQDSGNNPLAKMKTSHGLNLHKETRPDKKIFRDNISFKPVKDTGDENELKSALYRQPSLEDDKKIGNGQLNNVTENSTVKECGSAQVEDSNKCEDILDNPMADALSASDLSPDDVLGIMGEKEFWRTRRAIVK